MDHGAARSRKNANRPPPPQPERQSRSRIEQLQDAPQPSAAPGPSRFKPKVIDNTDPARFRPKAIRDSTALIWSQGPFPLPPSAEAIANVTRVDLTGSECTDVTWLAGSKVTWLSLKGCKVQKGWDEVGALDNLAVLNISDTDLKSLPTSFRNLTKLKALVAMNLPWTSLDEEIVGQWEQLNSLIISHSPNLTALPRSLNSLAQLSKLTCSHCPRLSANKIPDLSDLPLLRDVKMNNLALVDSIPSHMARWGTGRLPANEHTSAERQGDGLEVLDLGNCSLPFTAVQATFLSKKWPQLRSLSLHSNPLAISNPDYATALQDSETLPKLQIIDSKRVVERKRKGEVQESKIERRRREKKEKKRMTGANARETTGKVRVWGESGAQETGANTTANDASSKVDRSDARPPKVKKDESTRPAEKKRKRADATVPAAEDSNAANTGEAQQTNKTPSDKKRKRSKPSKADAPSAEVRSTTARDRSTIDDAREPAINKTTKSRDTIKAATDEPISSSKNTAAKPSDPKVNPMRRKADGGKVETVAKSAGGVDLSQVFGKPQSSDDAGGLGVGGW